MTEKNEPQPVVAGYEESAAMQALDRMEGDPGPAKEPESKPNGKDVEAADAPASDKVSARLEALERELTESRAAAKSWMEIAQRETSAKPPEKAEVAEKKESLADKLKIRKADPTDTAEKLIDDLESRGLAALGDRGLVTEERLVELVQAIVADRHGVSKADVREMIDVQVDALSADRKLARKHPELEDEDSPIFAAVRKEVQTAVDGGDKSVLTPIGLERVVRAVKAEAALAELKAGKGKRRPARETDDDAAGASRRRARAEAQDVAGSGSAGGDDADDSDELTEQQETIRRKMGVSLNGYKQHAKTIRMGGIFPGGQGGA